MTTVVGVRFREVGKIYYFDPGELVCEVGQGVIVDTARGTEYGTVIIANRQVEDEEIVQPLKVVRRIATPDDIERVRVNRSRETDAFAICKEKIKEHGLEMKLISAEYTFDNSKVLFYFTADGRIDFRELVKDLASVFKIRIELRQVGVRDETKLMGGLGGCGRPLCCASYLSDFVPVSIRMAKEQNLSLNPQKISGVCGRLMCCLKNEAETYEYLNASLPKEGQTVTAPDGREGKAESLNVLRQKVRVLFVDEEGNREIEEYPASELTFVPRKMKAAQKTEDAVEEISEELMEEEETEQDEELIALAEAEIDDLEAREDAEGNGRKRRQRRRRGRRNGDERDNGPEQEEDQNSGEPRSRENDNEDRTAEGEGRRSRRERGGRRARGERPSDEGETGTGYADPAEHGPGRNPEDAGSEDGRRRRPRRRPGHERPDGEDAGYRDGGDGSAESGSDGMSEGREPRGEREYRRNRDGRRRRRERPENAGGNAEGSDGSGIQNDRPQNDGAQNGGSRSGERRRNRHTDGERDAAGGEGSTEENGEYRRPRRHRRPRTRNDGGAEGVSGNAQDGN